MSLPTFFIITVHTWEWYQSTHLTNVKLCQTCSYNSFEWRDIYFVGKNVEYFCFSLSPLWLLSVVCLLGLVFASFRVHPEILKKGSPVHPTLLRREVEAVRDKQRSPLYCDQLLQHIGSLHRETTAKCTEWHEVCTVDSDEQLIITGWSLFHLRTCSP